MSSPRLLVIEGNAPESLAEHVAAGGTPAHEGYSNLLRELLPGAIVDTAHPGDLAATLPEGESLEGYDGIAITGSSLHVYQGGPAVTRQIDLVRAALATGTPVFGSCWGLQVITAAAGGVVRKNPKGREIGFGRGIRLTDELDTYRELASATLEAYLSTVNNNLSLIMKRLTGVTVVVAGIGAIGGIFGMSEAQYAFRLDEGPGFWIVVFGSLVVAGLAAAALRRIDWI